MADSLLVTADFASLFLGWKKTEKRDDISEVTNLPLKGFKGGGQKRGWGLNPT